MASGTDAGRGVTKQGGETAERKFEMLSDRERKEIQRLHRAGWTISALARKFGVARNAIRYWVYPERRKRLRGKELAEHNKKQRDCQRAQKAKRTKKEQAEHIRRQRENKRAWLARMTKKELAEFKRKAREYERARKQAGRAR